MSADSFPILDEILNISIYKNQAKILNYLSYNTIGGKGIRIALFNMITEMDNQETKLTSYMFEVLQAGLVVLDDIMDNSDIRRGQECYYKKQGMVSLKYSAYFLAVVSKLISKKCKNIYIDVLFSTCLGQILDSKKKNENEYNNNLYNIISEYKTSVYTFYFPLVSGYAIMNKPEPINLYEFAKILGIIFQMQDDYLNFFPSISKKTGNDLEEKKLTYFTCKLYEENEILFVNNFYKSEVVSSEIIEKVHSYFPEYQKKINNLLDIVENLSKSFDINIYKLMYDLLEKRMFRNH